MGSISISALLDSGATDYFVDKRWAQERCLRLLPLQKKVPVLNVDGTTNCAGEVSHGLWCYATNLGKTPMILGHTWLKTHNPEIDWVTGRVTLNRCPPECCQLQESPSEKKLHKEESKETWVQALEAWEERVKMEDDELESMLEDAQKLVPKEYWEYIDVFSKKSSECMPLHKPWDHAIDLKSSFEPKKGRLIPLSVDEQQEVEGFLEDQLRKGYIRPSNSPKTSPVFFVPKKDGKK
ncbi:hypothetical protein ID866_10672 [Astraeus odoratus]|nr:hypothetical protein ID866_10672 [Astraeus odoratus]